MQHRTTTGAPPLSDDLVLVARAHVDLCRRTVAACRDELARPARMRLR